MKNFQKLKHRSSFLKVKNKGEFIKTPNFFIQILASQHLPEEVVFFFGVTASKKVGKAVERNYAKRRMRALFKESIIQEEKIAFPKGYTYEIVLIAKRSIQSAPYAILKQNFEESLKKWLKNKNALLTK